SQQHVILGAVKDSIERELSSLQMLLTAHTSEARTWFLFGVVAAILGFLVILTGSVASLAGLAGNGWTAAIAGSIPTAASALFFRQKNLSDRLVAKDMMRISELREEERQLYWVLQTDDPQLFNDFARRFLKLPRERTSIQSTQEQRKITG